MTLTKWFATPIHPILIGFYPVLTLYYLNIGEMAFSAITQSAITSGAIVLATTVVCVVATRSWRSAATPISLSLLMIFTYGHFYNLLEGTSLAGVTIGRHLFLVPLWVVALLYGNYHLIRKKIGQYHSRQLNTISGIMLASIVVQIGFQIYKSNPSIETNNNAVSSPLATESIERDVYYILLDAYSREDLLRDVFHLDASQFFFELEQLGFYIPQCAQSNYFNTYPAMTSTFNMDYLDSLGIDVTTADSLVYAPYIQSNLVLDNFKALGYQLITFKGLYPTIDIKDTAYHIDVFDNSTPIGSLDSINFQYIFLKTTIFSPLLDFLGTLDQLDLPATLSNWLPIASASDSREFRQYQQSVFALNTLESLPTMPGKKFVYAHLFITHQPFVFYPDGRFHESLPQNHDAYRDQVEFANKRIIEIVKSLLDKSENDPIIVIQSDHSYLPGEDRVKILNAYYLPDGGEAFLYETITPINTFRLIFNIYFNGEYPLLPDTSTYMIKKVGNFRHVEVAPSTCVNN